MLNRWRISRQQLGVRRTGGEGVKMNGLLFLFIIIIGYSASLFIAQIYYQTHPEKIKGQYSQVERKFVILGLVVSTANILIGLYWGYYYRNVILNATFSNEFNYSAYRPASIYGIVILISMLTELVILVVVYLAMRYSTHKRSNY